MNYPTDPTRRKFLSRAGLVAVSGRVATARFAQSKGKSNKAAVRFTMMLPGPRSPWWSTLRDETLLVQRLGFEGIEITPRYYLRSGKTTWEGAPSFFRGELKGIAMDISVVGGSVQLQNPDPKVRAQALQDERKYLEMAKTLGVGQIGEHYLPEAETLGPSDHWVIDALKQLAPDIKRTGVGIVLEPMSHPDGPAMDLLKHGAQVVDAVGAPGITLVADFDHLINDKNDIPGSFTRWGKLIGAVHFPGLRRMEPSGAIFDYRPGLHVLKQQGYSGWFTMECYGLEPHPEEPLGQALTYVKKQWNEA